MEEGTPPRRPAPELIAARVCSALNAAGARYLVIGGIACILHGYVRATVDLDVLIERSPDNAVRVLEALSNTGYGFAREWTATELLARPITVIGDDPAVDVFTVAWTVKYEQAITRSVSAQVEGVTIPFIGHRRPDRQQAHRPAAGCRGYRGARGDQAGAHHRITPHTYVLGSAVSFASLSLACSTSGRSRASHAPHICTKRS